MQITAINIYARKVVQTTRRDILWKLWSCDPVTNEPESEITSGSISTSAVPTTSGYVSLAISPITISAGTKYAIGIASPSVAGNDLFYTSTAASPYDSYFIDGGRYDTVGITMNGSDVPALKLQVYIDSVLVGNQGGASYANYGISGLPNQPAYLFNVFETASQEKAVSPTPTDAETNVETEPSILLQWEPGDEDNPPDSYMVYVGGGLWFDEGFPTSNPYLDYSGKIFGPTTTWRVDSIYGATTVTGDEWTFTPSVFSETTYDSPNSPTPIHESVAGYFNGVTCAWKGDSRSTSFELWRGVNGADATLYSTVSARLSVNTGLTNEQTVIWHVVEQVPSGWIQGPSWSYTVSTANYPSSGEAVTGCVPMPNKKVVVVVCGTKLYFGEV